MTVKLARTRELEAQLYNAEKAIVVSRLASAIAHENSQPAELHQSNARSFAGDLPTG